MELEALVQEVKSGLEGFKTSANQTIADQKTAIEALTAKMTEIEKLGGVSVELETLKKDFNTLVADLNEKDKQPKGDESVTLKKAFSGIVKDMQEELKGFTKNTNAFSKTFQMKAVGDITFGNFGAGSYEALTTQTLPGFERDLPLQDFWFRNILPVASTESEVIRFLRYDGGEGAAAIWDERANPLEAKPQIDLDFSLESEDVIWIAGTARTHRGMLMDAPFLNTFIPQELVYGDRGILVAENQYIWSKLVANSTAYDNGSSLTVPVERIYDAAFGQLKDYRRMPTHILMNHRDELKYIAFNKATGSGEYNLPEGTVTVVNGKLYINGVRVIGVPDIPVGKFMVLDSRATTFFSRLSPEVQTSAEDRDNFIKNLITFRAEERAAMIVKNIKGVIYGDLLAAPGG